MVHASLALCAKSSLGSSSVNTSKGKRGRSSSGLAGILTAALDMLCSTDSSLQTDHAPMLQAAQCAPWMPHQLHHLTSLHPRHDALVYSCPCSHHLRAWEAAWCNRRRHAPPALCSSIFCDSHQVKLTQHLSRVIAPHPRTLPWFVCGWRRCVLFRQAAGIDYLLADRGGSQPSRLGIFWG